MTVPSQHTPVATHLPRERRPWQVGLGGFAVLILSTLGQMVKDAGLSGTAKQIAEIVGHSWPVALSLISLSLAWVMYLTWKALIDRAESERAQALLAREDANMDREQIGARVSALEAMVSSVALELRAVRDDLRGLPEAFADALRREPTRPKPRPVG